MLKKYIVTIWILLSMCMLAITANTQAEDNIFGQTIQIHTRFSSFIGKPSWLLTIRDVDHGDVIPYLFDIRRGDNYWVAFTYGRNYLITISDLRIETYQPRYNTFKKYETKDFCHLESNGRIIRGESISITIDGDLSPYTDSYSCHVSQYPDGNFTFVNQDNS